MKMNKPEPKTKLLVEGLGCSIQLPHAVVVDLDWEISKPLPNAELKIFTVVDCETASLDGGAVDFLKDKVIELCLANILVDANSGQVIKIVSALNQLIEPPFPISDFTSELTGITQEMVNGHKFNESLTAEYVKNSELIIAHNASFDKKMTDQLSGVLSNKVWACSCKGDINWKGLGLSSSGLEFLVLKHGFFYDAHRASPDVFALIQLLSVRQDAMYSLIQSSMRLSYKVCAIGAPFAVKDQLKSLGYSPVYENSKFLYWCLENLSEEQAKDHLKTLSSIYQVNEKEALTTISPIGRYS